MYGVKSDVKNKKKKEESKARPLTVAESDAIKLVY
jgi:hypothetical protein